MQTDDPKFTADATTRAKRWCFTIFNYTPEILEYLTSEETDENDDLNAIHKAAEWYAFNQEVCPSTGRPHLQGAVVFHEALRFNPVKELIPGAHLSKMWSTPQKLSLIHI